MAPSRAVASPGCAGGTVRILTPGRSFFVFSLRPTDQVHALMDVALWHRFRHVRLLLLRCYGSRVQELIRRDCEAKAFEGMGPQVHSSFDDAIDDVHSLVGALGKAEQLRWSI